MSEPSFRGHASGRSSQPSRATVEAATTQVMLATDFSQRGTRASGLVIRHSVLHLAVAFVRGGIAIAEIVRGLGDWMVDSVDYSAQQALSGPALADGGRRL